MVSFNRNRQIKMSGRTHGRTDFFFILTYIHMTHVNFFHRLLVSETQTDRQNKIVIHIYVYIKDDPNPGNVTSFLVSTFTDS